MAAKTKFKILAHPDLDTSELKTLGHEVTVMPLVADYDLILGPNCWRVTPHLTKFIKAALTAAKNTKVRRTKK